MKNIIIEFQVEHFSNDIFAHPSTYTQEEMEEESVPL